MIKSKRLDIRRIIGSDWKAIQEIWMEVSKIEYAKYDEPKNTKDEEVKKRIEKWASAYESSEHMFFAVCLEKTVIGYVAFNKRKDGYEMGYCFHPSYYRKGYAKESIQALIDMMKEKGVTRIIAGTAMDNIPSVNLLKSLNFKLNGNELVSFYKDNQGNNIFFTGGKFELAF